MMALKFKRYGVIKITRCSDTQLWYAKLVGQYVPNLGFSPRDGYRSREATGFTNFVRECDAVPMTVLVSNHQQGQWPYIRPMGFTELCQHAPSPISTPKAAKAAPANGQSHAHSWAESATNIAIGFGVSVVITAVALPAYGHHVTLADNLQITAIFTVASLLRSYALRRFFNRITTRESA